MKTKGFAALLVAGVALLLSTSCEYDHGIDPIRTRIKGSIIFAGATPGNVREARLVVVKNLPPENLTTDVIFSDPLPFKRNNTSGVDDTVHYELVVEQGVYPIAGVLWRPSDKSWDIANIIGLYLKLNLQNLSVDTKVDVQAPLGADSIDVYANWDLARRDAEIAGSIDFKGQWREDTDLFVIGCYSSIPRNSLEFLTGLLSGSAAFQLVFQRAAVDSLPYRIQVNSQAGAGTDRGLYKFIALFWKGKVTSLSDIRAIGMYRCDGDSTLPRFAATFPDSTTSNIDFSADFSTLPAGINYRKDGALCP